MVDPWLRRIALATLLASFATGPSVINIGPADINVFDTLFLATSALFFVSVTLKGRFYVRLSGVSALGLAYPFIVVVGSLSGAILYGYPAGYIVGDLRWIQVIFIMVFVLNTYKYRRLVVDDFKYVIYYGIAINSIFVVLQMEAATSGEAVQLLEWWYKDVPETAKRPLGFQFNRFSGAVGQPSGLGFFAAVSIGYALVVMKNSITQVLVLVGSILLLIASGSRTAMVAISAVVVVYLIFLAGRNILRYILYLCLVLVVVIPVAISLDLGRIAETDRYRVLVELATGEVSYHEVANRGEAWQEAIDRRNREYLILGTLSNPSHVYSDLIIDSGYLHVFVRLGPIGLLFLVFMMVTPLVTLFTTDKDKVILLPACYVFIIGIMMVNQNTLTTVGAKVTILFSTLCNSTSLNA